MTQRTLFIPRFGWRTFSVGQIHMSKAHKHIAGARSEERRVGKDVVGVDLGGRRIIKKLCGVSFIAG